MTLQRQDFWSVGRQSGGITRIAAGFATGNVTIIGTNGTIIPALTEVQRSDGALFSVNADVTIALGSAVAVVTAVDAGVLGNTIIGTVLTLSSPIAGVNNANANANANALSGASNAETDLALRTRFITRIQQPPHGGAGYDYIAWALEVAGVTRAWVYPQENGVGSITVRFVRDLDVSLIPDARKVATVQAYIDARRPVTAIVTVGAPSASALNFTIQLTPNTVAVKNAVTAELTDLINREAIPGGTIFLSHIRAAISAAAGKNNFIMSSPSADIVNTLGVITTMGTITWL